MYYPIEEPWGANVVLGTDTLITAVDSFTCLVSSISSAPRIVKLRLLCVAFGSSSDDVFRVRIPEDEDVVTLRELIKTAQPGRFAGIDSAKLRLFNINLPGWGNLGDDGFRSAVESAVLNGYLGSACQMKNIFKSFEKGSLHIVVQTTYDAQNTIIESLKTGYDALFRCLQVQVSEFGSWSASDVSNNGGQIFLPDNSDPNSGDPRPPEIVEIETRLAKTRTYAKPPHNAWCPGFRDARSDKYAQLFQKIYVEAEDPPFSVKHDREFLAFFNILECYQTDSDRISSDGSSSMKASHLIVNFIVPPFFSCGFEGLEYKEQESLGFPIFLARMDQPDMWCKYVPISDFMVAVTSSICPLITSEVISQKGESDKQRMLLQAIAIARAGQYLIKANEQFFVVAIYLRADMTAQRYVVAQTKDNGEKVFIGQKDFNLCDPNDSVSFLREMYNLATMLNELAGKFDPGKEDSLRAIHKLAAPLLSLTGIKENKRANNFVRGGGLASVPEAAAVTGGTNDDLGVFGADDVQAIPKEMKYKIDIILFGHPLVAFVSNVVDKSKTGFLKFIQDGRKETPILQYLSKINSPQNHTVPGVRFWPVRGGQVISMPSAGSWLTSLRNPNTQLWSVAGQLIEAIDFMHQHGVAHLDLKPANALIPLDGGRLSIIDFNTSVRITGVETLFSGVVGTPGYIPPEVVADRGPFSALRADLWSCGKTLSELCNLCQPSADRDTLFQISRALMHKNPEKRPTMPEVLERMADYKAREHPGEGVSCRGG